ncbi:TolB family protein [Truepera radiovictrix]|uniref:Lipoprotein n=1 Tax=Truepera radiovictrix (strain DSM 17093 / CIP 108686 / LMG 22925 / RQ-24) TaxID=649638 RepID=D7CRL0_TRURR|nr:hypothetical protein [Truepera radiovictrix]ADI13500.1 hypothetical protein Trad_0361 [Truepera radiovictrix DSM 17093]WMT57938.1 hypothetical protein RCV51_03065 [Truepera radiovictrix]
MKRMNLVLTSMVLVLLAASCTNISHELEAPFQSYFTFDEFEGIRTVSKTVTLEDGTVTTDGRVYLQDVISGKVTLLTTPERFGEHFYAEGGIFSPDGKTVFVNIDTENNWAIYAISLNSSKVTLIAEDRSVLDGALIGILGRSLAISPDGHQLAFRASRTVSLMNLDTASRKGVLSPFTTEHDLYILDVPSNLGTQATTPLVSQATRRGEAAALYPRLHRMERLNRLKQSLTGSIRKYAASKPSRVLQHSAFPILE